MNHVLSILGFLALTVGGYMLAYDFLFYSSSNIINGVALISASVGLFTFASIIQLLNEIRDTVASTQNRLLKEIRGIVAATKKAD